MGGKFFSFWWFLLPFCGMLMSLCVWQAQPGWMLIEMAVIIWKQHAWSFWRSAVIDYRIAMREKKPTFLLTCAWSLLLIYTEFKWERLLVKALFICFFLEELLYLAMQSERWKPQLGDVAVQIKVPTWGFALQSMWLISLLVLHHLFSSVRHSKWLWIMSIWKMHILNFHCRFIYNPALIDTIFFSQVGDFYEAIGIDACILVEYAGLNPFGGLRTDSIPRAGCPVMVFEFFLSHVIINCFK